ncbi:MAG TPA: hypothetical protein VLA68_02780, partial [Nitrososphaera sp.]|nr:hypothetical protein [Nitrososphaera sp.]
CGHIHKTDEVKKEATASASNEGRKKIRLAHQENLNANKDLVAAVARLTPTHHPISKKAKYPSVGDNFGSMTRTKGAECRWC